MTGFIIFAIVLTLAYVLYFAAMIATDLAALKKASETDEENIDIGTTHEEVDEFATQNVVEDPSTGGFNFVSSQQKEEEVATEIEEAEEVDDDDVLRYDNDNYSEANSEQAHDDENYSETEEANSENQEQELEDNEEPEEDLGEPEPEDEPVDEESGGFEVHDFSEQEDEQPEQKSFKEDDAFDPSLRQKKYDVKNVFEPTASPEVNGHANTVNAALESITTKSVCLTSTGLLSAVRNHTADRYNIDYNHVQTKF